MRTRKFSLTKSERILKNPEFVRIQKVGKRLHSKNFILVLSSEEPFSAKRKKSTVPKVRKPRIGITITKKLEASAVRRNRVKRLIREAFRHIKQHCQPALSLVVIAKQGSVDLGFEEVKRQLLSALKFNGSLI